MTAPQPADFQTDYSTGADWVTARLAAWLDAHPVTTTDHDRRVVDGSDDAEVTL